MDKRKDDTNFDKERAQDQIYFEDKSRPKLREILWPAIYFQKHKDVETEKDGTKEEKTS